MEFFKVICGVIISILLAIKLKQLSSPIWIYLSLGISLFVLFYILGKIGIILSFIDDFSGQVGLNKGYFVLLIKIVGISYLCEFTSNICKEAGFLAIASQVEIGGKITMMIISMPILLAIMDTLSSL